MRLSLSNHVLRHFEKVKIDSFLNILERNILTEILLVCSIYGKDSARLDNRRNANDFMNEKLFFHQITKVI